MQICLNKGGNKISLEWLHNIFTKKSKPTVVIQTLLLGRKHAAATGQILLYE